MKNTKASTSTQAGRARPPGAPKQPSRGKNQLCYPKIADAIFDSVEFRNRNNVWYARLVRLMPDHLHALTSFPYERPMKQIMADWKRFLAKQFNIEWQPDFLNHRLRAEESYREKADYIRANPVRAGLVNQSEEWPFFWTVNPQGDAPSEGRAYGGDAARGRALSMLVAIALLLAGCRPDMMNQPKAKPLSQSDFFTNGTNARPPPPHSVPYGTTDQNAAFYTGLMNGTYITQLPVKLTPELLNRGRDQFEAMCAECHDRTGSGNGMVVQRGFPQPPSFHADRLREAPIGHFYNVITNGYGVMYPYATRVEPEDRWAIAAYIRALQLSHNAKASDVDPAERTKLEAEK